jgi:hypothetical protein
VENNFYFHTFFAVYVKIKCVDVFLKRIGSGLAELQRIRRDHRSNDFSVDLKAPYLMNLSIALQDSARVGARRGKREK